MEKGKKLSKDAKPGEMTIRGTRGKPDITGDPPVIGEANARYKEGLKDIKPPEPQ